VSKVEANNFRLICLHKSSEIAGKAGLGKTQLCLQLCATVQVPSVLGGLEGEAVFLDTEGAFCGERMAEVGQATKEDVVVALEAQGTRCEENLCRKDVRFILCSF
jgi:RecA/RadA recombinase